MIKAAADPDPKRRRRDEEPAMQKSRAPNPPPLPAWLKVAQNAGLLVAAEAAAGADAEVPDAAPARPPQLRSQRNLMEDPTICINKIQLSCQGGDNRFLS